MVKILIRRVLPSVIVLALLVLGFMWLHVTHFVDDCHIRLGAATTGVYAYDPEMVLVERR